MSEKTNKKELEINKIIAKIEQMAKNEDANNVRLACLRYNRKEIAKRSLMREIVKREKELEELRTEWIGGAPK